MGRDDQSASVTVIRTVPTVYACVIDYGIVTGFEIVTGIAIAIPESEPRSSWQAIASKEIAFEISTNRARRAGNEIRTA
jgi:hypothetical protein